MKMMPEIHVVIASVAWREENLIGLLDDVKRQTVKPASIRVLLDGYTAVPSVEGVQFFFATPQNSGGGWHRFRHIEDRVEGLVAIIDDDFRIEPDYLERLHACRERHPNSIVSWHCPTIRIFEEHTEDSRVDSVGAGMCLFHTDQIAGMSRDAATLSMINGD